MKRSGPAARQKAEQRGRRAEFLALVSLSLKGYRLLAWRYKSRFGEIDLIMRRGEVTAFIEVKARANRDLAVEAVTPYQIKRIQAAARSWMSRDPLALRGICRFDIVVVCPWRYPYHLENAFYGDS